MDDKSFKKGSGYKFIDGPFQQEVPTGIQMGIIMQSEAHLTSALVRSVRDLCRDEICFDDANFWRVASISTNKESLTNRTV